MKSPLNQNEVNPLLIPWDGPFGGLPPFELIRASDFKAALETGMAAMRAEILAIAENPELPSFENTLARLEDSGRLLDRVQRIYAIWTSTCSDPEMQMIEQDMAPRLASFEDEFTQNEKLFSRIQTVYQGTDYKLLSPEQQRLCWKYYTDMRHAGAQLKPELKTRLTEINQSLAKLFTEFNQNLLKDESSVIFLEKEEDLLGLPDSFKQSAAAIAKGLGETKKWAINNTRSSVEPFLSYSSREDLRKKVWWTYTNRGNLGNSHDNNKIITQIMRLRLERAKLLGYTSHAHWRLENSMAKTPDRALALMEEVWRPALARVQEEVQEMLILAKKIDGKNEIQAWDYRYYSELVRQEKYAVSEQEIKPYFQHETLREGMFWVAEELFGLKFSELSGVPVVHPDIRVWKVEDLSNGSHQGLWYFDPYARAGKRSGAWMSNYRNQEKFRGEISSIVSNNSNFVKASAGEAVLISLNDALTLFHEFGHALHGLSSQVQYPNLSGTAVPRDYVEFPSQLFENWLLTPEVLGRFALHHISKKAMPKELLDKITRASTFNQGFQTVEYLASALLDMKWHLSTEEFVAPAQLEQASLAAIGMPKEIVMRHRPAHFAHIFGSDSYSANYYSYLWLILSVPPPLKHLSRL
ncbi:MAG: M3 family metallopeptidase, partial [Proteobacteria bacterium]|nr:M3 family metallopeptidase [Pseudomonadota bacterium]